MEYSPTFLRLRAIAFMCLTVICLIWVVILCLILNWRWELSNTPFRSMLILLLLANVITPIMLPILMIVLFRPWLDAARFLFLFIAHIGSAVMFAYWNPTFECSSDTVDDQTQFRMLIILMLAGSWVIPVFLLLYSSGLAFMMYRRSQLLLSAPQSPPLFRDDEVENVPPMSGLPPNLPDVYLSTPFTLLFPPSVPPDGHGERDSWRRYSQMEPGPSRMSQRFSTLN